MKTVKQIKPSLWVALVTLAVLAFVARPAQAAVIEAWVQRYNGPANDRDIAYAVAVDGSGNVVVTGFSYHGSGDYNTADYYTAKYAATNGALVWEKRYNGPADRSDGASAVALDGSGNVVVTGNSWNGANSDYYTAKYAAANGALLWEKRYNGPSNIDDYASAVAVDGSGNVVVTGSSASGVDISGNQITDYYTAKYAATNGALLWEKRYNGPGNGDDKAYAVAVDGSGNVVVTGGSYTNSSPIPDLDYYTAKYAAANGALLWEKRYNGPANSSDIASAVAVDSSGNVVVTGRSYNFVGSHDYYTAKYAAANGALLWEKRYVGPGTFDDARAVAVDANGNVVVTGASDNAGNISDYYTAKYAATNGALLWEKRYNGPANGSDIASAVAVDSSGNVVVTGYSASSGSPGSGFIYDYYTAKYAAANGALLWEKRYNGPANATDGAVSLALGPNGMVAITGYSYGIFNALTTSDYATVVYWEKLPPVVIAADGAGGYFIRGSGRAGSIYQLQRATSVTGPWTSNATITAASPGLIEFHDTNAPPGQTFYRTVQP